MGSEKLRRYVSKKTVASAALIALALPVAPGCNTADDLTGTSSQSISMTSAIVAVDGEVMNGRTLPPGQGVGASTRFEATLREGERAGAGHRVRVQFERPHGMMNRTGEFEMFDDGTHGDRVAHDGVYCYEDFDGRYGCHGENARAGRYHYDFYGMDSAGHHTNHLGVVVILQ